MKPLMTVALLLSVGTFTPAHGQVADSMHPRGKAVIQPLPTTVDTTMLTGNGLNTTGGPIDRVAPGGVWRKERGATTWTFTPQQSQGDPAQQRQEYFDRLMREHGDEPRDLVVAVRDTSDARKLRTMGLSAPNALPCSLTVRVKYRQLPEMRKAGLLFWGVGARPRGPASRPTRPQPTSPAPAPRDSSSRGRAGVASPDGVAETMSCSLSMPFSDGFETYGIPGPNWTATNYSYYTTTYWGSGASGCDVVRSGYYDASAAGNGGPCYYGDGVGYDNGEDTDLDLYDCIDMSAYSQYTVSYWVYYNVISNSDYINWYYDTGGGYQQNGHFTGSSGGWVQKTLVFPNSGHTYDHVRMRFEFLSGYGDNTGYAGAYVDDISISGTLFQPNLTYYTNTPIIPSSVQGTTNSTLYAGSQTYVDWAIQNNGLGSTSNSFTIDYYLDNTWIGNDIKSGLNANTSYTHADWPFTVATPGSHTLKMVIDSGNNVVESNEGDNTFTSQSFYWNPCDLTVSVVPSKTSPTVGDTMSVWVTVKNQGVAPVSGTFYTRFYKNLAFHPTACQAGQDATFPTFTLASGATYSYPITGLTSNVAGTWTMWAYADDCGQITYDSNTSNNYNQTGVTVTWGSGTVTLTGTFAYDDSVTGNKGVPLRGAHVVLYQTHNGQSSGDSLATTYTNVSGQFAFTNLLNRDPVDQGLLDVYVRAYAQADSGYFGHSVVSIEDANSARYFFQSMTVNNVANGTHPFGVIKPDTTDYVHNAADHMYSAILMGWDWVTGRGSTVPPVYLYWYPQQSDGTKYVGAKRTIKVFGVPGLATLGPDAWDDTVLLHEYGHHVSGALGFSNSPGGDHSFILPDTTANGQASMDLAWSEGWATAFACFAKVPGPNPVWLNTGVPATGGGSDFNAFNAETGVFYYGNGGTTKDINALGATWEGSVAALVWDVYDSVNDNPNGDAYADQLSDVWGPMWDVCTNHPVAADSVYTIPQFYTLYSRRDATTPDRLRALNQTFGEHGMLGAMPAGVADDGRLATERFALGPANPNPVVRGTVVSFVVPSTGASERVSIRLYDVTGRMVRSLVDGVLPAGRHAVEWTRETDQGESASPGVYFVCAEHGRDRCSRRVVVLR